MTIDVTAPPDTITTNSPTILADMTGVTGSTNHAGPESTTGDFSIPVLSLLENDTSTAGGNALTMTVTGVSSSTAGVSLTSDHDYVLFPFLTLGGGGTASGTFTITISDGTTVTTDTVTVNEQSSIPNVGNIDEGGLNGNTFIIENLQTTASWNLENFSGNDILVANTPNGSNLWGYNQTTNGAPKAGDGNDLLISDHGGGTLIAGDGNDTLWINGTGGNLNGSKLSGSTTTFYFHDTADNSYTLNNYAGTTGTSGQNDIIAISASGFGGGLTAGENVATAGIFATTSNSNVFPSTSDRFVLDQVSPTTERLYYSADGTTGHEVLLATITNGGAVHPSDIHVVT